MFGFKKAEKPQTGLNVEQLQRNLAKSRELNAQFGNMSGSFIAQTTSMLNSSRKEIKRV